MGGRPPAGLARWLSRDAQRSVRRTGQGRPQGGDWQHWRAARVNGLDDLGVVDALETNRVPGGSLLRTTAERCVWTRRPCSGRDRAPYCRRSRRTSPRSYRRRPSTGQRARFEVGHDEHPALLPHRSLRVVTACRESQAHDGRHDERCGSIRRHRCISGWADRTASAHRRRRRHGLMVISWRAGSSSAGMVVERPCPSSGSVPCGNRRECRVVTLHWRRWAICRPRSVRDPRQPAQAPRGTVGGRE
jgi:hypothetical protein